MLKVSSVFPTTIGVFFTQRESTQNQGLDRFRADTHHHDLVVLKPAAVDDPPAINGRCGLMVTTCDDTVWNPKKSLRQLG